MRPTLPHGTVLAAAEMDLQREVLLLANRLGTVPREYVHTITQSSIASPAVVSNGKLPRKTRLLPRGARRTRSTRGTSLPLRTTTNPSRGAQVLCP